MELRSSVSLLVPFVFSLLIFGNGFANGEDSSKNYIIHMCRNASHTNMVARAAHYNALLDGAKALIGQHVMENILHHVYEHALDGFSARLTTAQAEYVKRLPGVMALYPDKVRQPATTRSADFLGLTQNASQLWPLSKGGEDVIIGVLDSGIWPERLSFSGKDVAPIPARWNGSCVNGTAFDPLLHCNNKLIGAKYFVAGNVADSGPINETLEFLSPRDFGGHGTHCAGTAGGRAVWNASSTSGLAAGTAYGMAPNARIAIYKVCWDGRGCSDSDILAGYDAALADGVDVISFSIGAISGGEVAEFADDVMAISAYSAVKRGVFVSASAGNDGPALFTVENVAPWFMTVAAATQDRENQGNVSLGDGQVVIGRSNFDGSGMANGPKPLLYAGTAPLYSNFIWNASVCQRGALDPSLVLGKVILCDFDPGYSDLGYVFESGATGVIFANSEAKGEGLSMVDIPPGYAFTQVGYRARAVIVAYLQANPSTGVAALLPTKSVLNVVPAPEVAIFSSRGPIRYRAQWLKPDILAPGVDILAAGIRDEEFAFRSGTSMSCPHITGIAAAVKAVHPTWSPAMIKSALMTTATTADNSATMAITTEEDGLKAYPTHFGAGFVRPERAISPGLVYDMTAPDYLNFLCEVGYTLDMLLRVDPLAPPCPLTPLRVEDTNLPSFYALYTVAGGAVTVPNVTFARTLTNVEATGGTYTADLVGASSPEITVAVAPSTLAFTAPGEQLSFTLTVTTTATGVQADKLEFAALVWSDGVHIVRTPIVAHFVVLS